MRRAFFRSPDHPIYGGHSWWLSSCSHPLPSVMPVSTPLAAVMVRLKQPPAESLEKNCCVLCWPVLPVMLKLASNSSVSLGEAVLETTLKVSSPSFPRPARRFTNCCLMVVVCAPVPSGFTMNEKSRSRGQSKRCRDAATLESSSPSWRVTVSEEMLVRCVMFCTKTVLVMLKFWLLEKLMSCSTFVFTRPCEVHTNPSTVNWRTEVTVTVPVMFPLESVVRFSATFGLGPLPMVFCVTSPVTTFH